MVGIDINRGQFHLMDHACTWLVNIRTMEGQLTIHPLRTLLLPESRHGQLTLHKTSDLSIVRRLVGHTNRVKEAEFSKDGRFLISGSLDGTALIWNLENDALDPIKLDHQVAVDRVEISDDGSIAITESNGIRVWNAHTGEQIGLFTPESMLPGSSFYVEKTRMVGAHDLDGAIRLWHLETLQTVELDGHRQHVNSARFSGSTGYIVSTGWDGWSARLPGCIRIWDAETGLPVATLGEPGEVAISIDISYDGKYAAVAITHGHQSLYIINLENGDLKIIPGRIDAIVTHPYEQVAVVIRDGFLQRIDLRTASIQIEGGPFVKPLGVRMSTIPGSTPYIVIPSSVKDLAEKQIAIFNADTLDFVRSFPGTKATTSLDGKELIIYNEQTGQLTIIDTATWSTQRIGTLDGIGSGNVVLSTNGDRAAATSPKDGAVMLWDMETLDRFAVFTGDGYPSDISWSPDGNRLIATWDKHIRIWDNTPLGQRAQACVQLLNAIRSLDQTQQHALTESQRQALLRATAIKRLQKGLEGSKASE